MKHENHPLLNPLPSRERNSLDPGRGNLFIKESISLFPFLVGGYMSKPQFPPLVGRMYVQTSIPSPGGRDEREGAVQNYLI